MADEKLIFDLVKGQDNITKALSDMQKQVGGVDKSLAGLSGSFASVGGAVASLRAGAVGLVAAIGGIFSAKVIRAAEEQEDAINRLNSALQISGDFSKEASTDLIDYASALQRVSKVGDEVTISNLALLKSLAPLTNEGLKQANTAAVNLSSALRIDLESAVRLVGKAANGNVEAFKRYGIEVRKGKTDAESFANALEEINKKAGGAAANELNTFSGATAQLSNNFGDVIEEIGLIIIQTPQLISVIKSSAESFASLAETVKEAAPEAKKFIGSFVENAGSLLRFAAEFAIVGTAIFKGVNLATSAIQLFRVNLEILQARNGVGIFTALSREVLVAAGAMRTLQIATIATRVAITALKAVGTLGATLALDAAITSLLELREEFGSLEGAVEALWIKFKKFGLEAISSVAETLGGLFEAAASVPGSPEFLTNISEGLKRFNNSAKDSVKNLSKELDNIKSVSSSAEEQVGRSTASIAKNLLKTSTGLDDIARKTLESNFASLEKELKNAGVSALDQIAIEGKSRFKIINDAFKDGLINSEKERAALQLKNQISINEKVAKAQADIFKQQADDAAAFLNSLRGNLPQPGAAGNPSRVSQGNQLALIAAEAGNSLLKGAEGAVNVIKSGITVAATAIAGPLGQAIGPVIGEIVSILSQGPEKVRELITSFLDSIPVIIENILLSLPVIIQTLAEQLPLVIEKLIENAPRIITEGILPRIPEIINGLIQGAIRAGVEFAIKMPLAATQFAVQLALEAPSIAIKTIDAFVSEAPRFITELIKQIPKAAGGAIGGIGDVGGGLLGGIGDALGGIGDVFGFAEGGRVPGGAPFTDRVPAMLTPGETIIDRSLTARLERFLNEGAQGQGQPMNVNLSIGEEQLANVLLNMNRRGFRTT